MIFGLFKTMYFFILHFEVRNLGYNSLNTVLLSLMEELETFFDDISKIKNEEEIIDFCRKYLIHGIPYIFRVC